MGVGQAVPDIIATSVRDSLTYKKLGFASPGRLLR